MLKESRPELCTQPIERGGRSSTAVVSTGELTDIWDEHLCADVRFQAQDGGSRRGGVRTGDLGAAVVSSVWAGPHSITARSATGGAHVHFLLVVTGSAVLAQDGREAVVRRGDLVCFDSSRPFTLTMPERFSLVAVRVTHAQLRTQASDTVHVTARPWVCDPGLPAVVCEALSGFGRHLPDLHDDIAELVGASFVNLLGMLLAQWLDKGVDDSEFARRALLDRVMRYGVEHLWDAELTPRKLARAHHMSVRHLQQLFADEGTSPARWIREERLARCHADLCDPNKRHLSVAAIGERWGLPNASHFSRQFRSHYGITPRDLRSTFVTQSAA